MSMCAPTRPALRYHGGKWRLAPWIIKHFPAHRTYVEPYGGAASVLLRKERAYAEVYNDLSGAMVDFFRVLRDPLKALELENLVRLTPFAREEFVEAYEPCEDAVESARRMLIRSFMGFGSAAACSKHLTGFRCNVQRSGSHPALDWQKWPDQIALLTERLQGVVLENRPAEQVIRHQDSPETLFYVDPPYPHATRTYKRQRAGQVYEHEMTDDDHRALATALRSAKGMVVLSGYPCSLCDQELYRDWQRVTCRALADGAQARTEVLWISPRAQEALNVQKGQLAL